MVWSSSDEDGFTLVELLVVVLVLAALVGIAVPTFVGQREGAWGAAVSSELRSAAIALESFRAQNGTYAAGALGSEAGFGFVPSPSVDLRYAFDVPVGGANAGYCMIAWFVPDGSAAAPSDQISAAASATTPLWGATPAGVVEGVDAGFCGA